MKRPIPLALWVLVLALGACSGGSEPSTGEMQSIVDGWAERNDTPVVVVSVFSPSGSITSVGYSALGGAPADSSLFLIGSMAKTMTAATTLLLVEDGVLDLDEPIEVWLPGFPRADELTLRQLLSHTAGLENESGASALFGPAAFAELQGTRTAAELLSEAASAVGIRVLPAPYQYTSRGYWVVGAVIEAATGEDLADVMHARVFEPLGMERTSLWPEVIDGAVVLGTMTVPGGLVVPLDDISIHGIASKAWAAGGLLSTAGDVAAFYAAVLDDLLAPASVEAMTTTTPGSEYGLGISARRWPGATAGWGHSGSIAGYSGSAGVTDDGWTVVVLTNHVDVADPAGSGRRAKDLIDELLEHIRTES